MTKEQQAMVDSKLYTRKAKGEASFAGARGSTAGTMRIEIDLKEEPSEYGGAVHLRIMRAIEAVFPDAKNRSASHITWQAEP